MSYDGDRELEDLADCILRVAEQADGERDFRRRIISILRAHDRGFAGMHSGDSCAQRERQNCIRKLHEVAVQLEDINCEQQVYELAVAAVDDLLGLAAAVSEVAEGDTSVLRAESRAWSEEAARPNSVYRRLRNESFRTGRTQYLADMHKHPEMVTDHPAHRSVVSVPIGEFGVLQCASGEEDAPGSEVVEVLEILALHLAAAVRRIRIWRRGKRERSEAERRVSEYAMIFSGMQDGMFLVESRSDAAFSLLRANSALERMTDGGRTRARAGSPVDMFGPDMRGAFTRHLRTCAVQQEPVSFFVELHTGDGVRFLSVQLSPLPAVSSDVKRLLGSVCDRTAERWTERALEESEEKYRTLVHNINDAILIVQGGRCVFANPAAGTLMGCRSKDLVGMQWRCIVHPAERARVDRMARARKRGDPVPDIYESAVVDHRGRDVDVEFNVSRTTYLGQSAVFISMRDIGRRKKVERRLRYLSFHDQLTDLYNRAYFENELRRLDVWRQLPLSVILADVNGLKLINDVFGHQEGDRLLREVADILRSSAREEDVVARTGGDEFAILIPQTSAGNAEEIMRRIHRRCAEWDDESFSVSVSMGVATKSEEGEDVWEVFGRAEERMYQDKMLRRDSARNAIIKSLRGALEEKTQETSEHMRRLEELGVAVGQRLGLAESSLSNLALLAQLHDIGKVAVPASVLEKEGPLDPAERAEIQRHPEIGYRIANNSVDLASISDSILSHHEWFDGSGYPRGLAGDAIPLLARILAVVDAFDAMTSERPYCAAMSREEALAEVRDGAGTQFDPEVAGVFLAMMEHSDRDASG